MRQYDLHPNPFGSSRDYAPLVVVLSSHLLDVGTAVVAPLLVDAIRTVRELHLEIEHEGRTMIVALHDLGSVDRALLRNPVGDLREHVDALERAVSRLFTGF